MEVNLEPILIMAEQKPDAIFKILKFLAIQTLVSYSVMIFSMINIDKNTNRNTVDKQIFKDDN